MRELRAWLCHWARIPRGREGSDSATSKGGLSDKKWRRLEGLANRDRKAVRHAFIVPLVTRSDGEKAAAHKGLAKRDIERKQKFSVSG